MSGASGGTIYRTGDPFRTDVHWFGVRGSEKKYLKSLYTDPLPNDHNDGHLCKDARNPTDPTVVPIEYSRGIFGWLPFVGTLGTQGVSPKNTLERARFGWSDPKTKTRIIAPNFCDSVNLTPESSPTFDQY